MSKITYKQFKKDVSKIKSQLESPKFEIKYNDSEERIIVKFKNIEFLLWGEDEYLNFKTLNQNQKFIRKSDKDEYLIYQAKNGMEVESNYNVCLSNNAIYLMGVNKDDNHQDWFYYSYEYLEKMLIALDDWNMNCSLLKEENQEIIKQVNLDFEKKIFDLVKELEDQKALNKTLDQTNEELNIIVNEANSLNQKLEINCENLTQINIELSTSLKKYRQENEQLYIIKDLLEKQNNNIMQSAEIGNKITNTSHQLLCENNKLLALKMKGD